MVMLGCESFYLTRNRGVEEFELHVECTEISLRSPWLTEPSVSRILPSLPFCYPNTHTRCIHTYTPHAHTHTSHTTHTLTHIYTPTHTHTHMHISHRTLGCSQSVCIWVHQLTVKTHIQHPPRRTPDVLWGLCSASQYLMCPSRCLTEEDVSVYQKIFPCCKQNISIGH